VAGATGPQGLTHVYRATNAGGSNPSFTLSTGQTGAILAITVNAQAQANNATTGLAQCQVALDGTVLDVQQITVAAGAAGSGQTLTLVGTGSSGAGDVTVQCSNSNGTTFGQINVQAIQLGTLN
jgi:hypothetical protein